MAKCIDVKLNDPQLREKAASFFLDTYRDKQAEWRKREKALAAEEKKSPPAKAEGGNIFHLGLDNLPEEYISSDDYRLLLSIRNAIEHVSRQPLPEVDNGMLAGAILLRRTILCQARLLVDKLLMYLLFDSRFHPERRFKCNAVQMLGLGDEISQQAISESIDALAQSMLLFNVAFVPFELNVIAADALLVFNMSGEIFFNTVQSVFPVTAINKCRIAFNRMVRGIGFGNSNELAANYIRRSRTMQREIEAWEANGGKVVPDKAVKAVADQDQQLKLLTKAVKALTDKVDATSETQLKKLDNFDRRQKTLFTYVKSIVYGLVKLLMPRRGKSGPTFAEVKDALLPEDHYACLLNLDETHRSQIRAVIDYTKVHPIVHKQKNRNQFSLANAARAVWNLSHEKWELIPGAYATFEQLKAACYNLQKGKQDPFYYQK